MMSNENHNQCALAVMAKVPRAGASKTRLVPPLTHAEAARLSACMLRDTLAHVATACTQFNRQQDESKQFTTARGVVIYAPDDAADELTELLPPSPADAKAQDFLLVPQRGADLTARLINAAEDLFAQDFAAVCLMNADSPTLSPPQLANAVRALATKRDAKWLIIIPAEDGGYCLIGFTQLYTELFHAISWSTAEVLAQTLARAQELNLKLELLPAAYDVDDEPSLQRLCAELGLTDSGQPAPPFAALTNADAPHTRAYLEKLVLRGRLHLLNI